MSALKYINTYVRTANEVASRAKVPAMVLLAIGALVSSWGKTIPDFVQIANEVRKQSTYNAASKYLNDHMRFFETLLVVDKEYYTLRSYIRMIRIALGYNEEVAYSDLVSQNKVTFMSTVFDIARKLNIDPEWLMIVMYNESKFQHRAVNPYTGAVGLIQFMPATARALGTSIEALKTMSNVQQLEYVYKYFKSKANKIYSLYDLYKITFFPISLGKSGDWVFQSSNLQASTVARQNKIFDLNKDGKITIDEFENYLFQTYITNLV